ncbi:MAG: cytochrome c [Rhizobiaceae bacterium]
MAGLVTLLALVTSYPSSAAAAENTQLIATGEAVARTWCMRCHVIGTGDQPSALADAPPFQAIARSGLTHQELSNALLSPHPAMPKFELTNDLVEALHAYINSLAE